VNAKMIPVETFFEWGLGAIKDSGEGGEFMYDIFDIL
jgi:hypothetical protein